MKSSTKHLRLFMIALFTCIACVCLVFGVTACSGGKSSGSIDIDETSVTISVGETYTITATATEKEGGVYTGNYVWTKDGDAIEIMTNGNSCMIKGISAGQASITVTAGSYSVRCDVTVIDSSTSSGTKNVETVSIEPNALNLYVGQSDTVSASLTVTGGTTYTGDYEWESSDTAIATVTKGENGSCTVTAVGAGTATITVTVGAEGNKKLATCTVTVEEDSIATLELSEEAIVVAKEGASTLIVTVKMTSGESSTDFEAKIEDDSIATIEVSGNTITVTGIETGETKITVTAGGITKECTVTVKEPEIAEITLSKTSVTLGTNETATINVTVKLDNGKTTDEYSASASCEPEDIVTANVANGILTISSRETEGNVKVTVAIEGTTVSTDCNVAVTNVQKEYHIDFSEPDTYEWIGTPATQGTDNETGETFVYLDVSAGTYETGILSFVAISGQTINKENVGALFTSSKNSTYFVIDLSGFEGSYVSIKVKMDANGSGSTRSLYVNNTGSNSSGIKSVSSSNKGDYGTLEYGQLISAGDVLYLTWDANIRIFTIDIEIQDASEIVPEVQSVTISPSTLTLAEGETGTLTATVTMNIGDYEGEYEWMLSDGGIVEMTWDGSVATVTAVAAGTVTVTVKAGGKEAVCTVTVRGQNPDDEEGITLSYVFGNMADIGTVMASQSQGDKFSFTETSVVKEDVEGAILTYTSHSDSVNTTNVTVNGVSYTTYIQMNGSTQGNGNRSFKIDLSSYVGRYSNVTIEVIGTCKVDSSDSSKIGQFMISTTSGNSDANAALAATSTSDVTENYKPGLSLKYTTTLEERSEFYITSANSARIYAIYITLGESGESSGGEGSGNTGSSGGLTFEELEGYEWIEFVADIESAYNTTGATNSNTKSQSAFTDGKFTFPSNMYYETESSGISGSYDVNTQGNNSITVVLSGVYNNLSFIGRCDNSVTVGIYKSGSSDALYVWTLGSTVSTCNYNTDTGCYLEAGTYLITTSATARLAEITASEYVEESSPIGINAEAATVDFLYGRSISESDLGLIVTLVYENTRTDPVSSGYTTDLASVANNLQPGANTVTVTYAFTDGESSQSYDFSTTVTIYLYELESIEISDFSMALVSGTYYTNNVQKIYLVGDTVSYNYAAVTGTASYGTENDKVSTTFILASSEVSFATANSTSNAVTGAFSVAGVYTVTATVNVALATDVSSSYTINVVDATNADITTVKVLAPSNVEDAEQATYAVGEDGVITVATINDAIQLIKLLGAPDNVRKYIYVGAGQYWEKIYIDIPNLTLVGANSSETDALASRQDSATGGTEIVYWAFNGLMDPSGTTNYSTVGSATVTVAKEAVGFCAANITFRNYWNTNALYNQCKEIDSNTQADAAYINADKVYFYNVTFTGYHDTLEAENGRQYYDHCYIEGRTDYIFGNTATCYFYYCNIHTIGAGEDKNGGYVMAIKGTGVDYGYIFNYCNFTTDLETYYTGVDVDEDFKYTVEGTVSVARTWSGSDMHIAILNSSFDAGFSKEAYIASTGKGESGKNSRYTHMTAGQAPTPEYLVEYGNTGDGAISASIDGTCTVYTNEADIADYLDFTKIFAIQNGSVKYDDDWSGHSVEIVTATVAVGDAAYIVTGYKGSLSVANVIAAVNEQLSGQEIETLYDENNQLVDAETKITEDVTFSAAVQEADMTVPSSVTYDFNGNQDDSTETLEGWYGYLYIDLGESNGSFASNQSGWYLLSGSATITVKISAGTTISVQMYEADAMAVNGATVTGEEDNGTYWYTCTATSEEGEELVMSLASNKSQLFIRTIEISVPVIYQIGDYIDIYDLPEGFTDIQGGATGEYKGIIIETAALGNGGSTGKFGRHSSGCAQINANTVLRIPSVAGATAIVTYYSGQEVYDTIITPADENGIITITFVSNTYITGITITAQN